MPDVRAGDDRYEGLHCTVCGGESDNTDWCVACAMRALRRDQEVVDD